MNDFFRFMLDLDTLHFGQEGVEFGLTRAWPGWVWAVIVLAGFGWAWWSYHRLEGSRGWRAALAGLRGSLVVLLALLIAGPRLLKPNETEEKDWVLVLVDRSASMLVRDAASTGGGVGGGAALSSREVQMRAALESSLPVWRELSKHRVVTWLGFDSGAFDLPATEQANPGALPMQLGEPTGRRTSLGRALEQALGRAAARPVSGVVVLSDGRSLDEPARATLRRLEADRIPVFTVALGSRDPMPDLAVRRAEAPRVAFINDEVPVEVELEAVGGSAGASIGATVELVDPSTGIVLAGQRVEFPPPEQRVAAGDEPPSERAATRRVTLTARPSDAGVREWTVRIRPEGRGSQWGDLIEENNSATVSLELVDRPLRIAFFDGYPRWEQRFLKSLLTREKSFESAVLLLASGRRYLQEGSITLDVLPRSPEEWRAFDVLVIGDVWPGVFTTEQLMQVRDHVAAAGAGLVLIGGEAHMPGSWVGTPMEDLIPFTVPLASASGGVVDSGRRGVPAWRGPVTMSATPLADRYGVLRLAEQPEPVTGLWWPARLSDPETGWSRLWWAQRIEQSWLKPAAEVLAVALPTSGDPSEGGPRPLVLSMRYGAGRVLYVGTDETWRWRYGRGEYYPERFWVQAVRMLGRESVARSGKAAVLEATPDRAEVERPIRVSVSLVDQSLVDLAPSSVRVRVRRSGEEAVRPDRGDSAAGTIELVLPVEGGSAIGSEAGRVISRTLATTWIPTEPGTYVIEASDPLLAASRLSTEVRVWLPDDELRRPQADHALLGRLSEASGGRSLGTDQLGELLTALPNRRLRLMGEPEIETLWDTPAALTLVVLLLTLEWVGRRLLRLA